LDEDCREDKQMIDEKYLPRNAKQVIDFKFKELVKDKDDAIQFLCCAIIALAGDVEKLQMRLNATAKFLYEPEVDKKDVV
jgi:hypothetical protein